MSLLAYSYFYIQDYAKAAENYDQLTKFYPDVTQYKLYHAQSLLKAGMYVEAGKVASQIEDPAYADKVVQIQVHIQYELEEMAHAKSLMSQLPPESAEAIVAQGCILYKEEKYEQAKDKFTEAL